MTSAVAVMALASPAHGAATVLTVSPVKVDLRAWPGADERRSISLTNEGDATLTVDASRADYRRAADGSAVYSVPSEGAASCARWISIPTGPVVLGPGGRAEVPLSVSVPSSATVGPRQAAVLISAGGEGAGGIARGRVAVLVLLSVEATPSAGPPESTSDRPTTDAAVPTGPWAAAWMGSPAVWWLAVAAGICFLAGVGLLLVDLLRRRRE